MATLHTQRIVVLQGEDEEANLQYILQRPMHGEKAIILSLRKWFLFAMQYWVSVLLDSDWTEAERLLELEDQAPWLKQIHRWYVGKFFFRKDAEWLLARYTESFDSVVKKNGGLLPMRFALIFSEAKSTVMGDLTFAQVGTSSAKRTVCGRMLSPDTHYMLSPAGKGDLVFSLDQFRMFTLRIIYEVGSSLIRQHMEGLVPYHTNCTTFFGMRFHHVHLRLFYNPVTITMFLLYKFLNRKRFKMMTEDSPRCPMAQDCSANELLGPVFNKLFSELNTDLAVQLNSVSEAEKKLEERLSALKTREDALSARSLSLAQEVNSRFKSDRDRLLERQKELHAFAVTLREQQTQQEAERMALQQDRANLLEERFAFEKELEDLDQLATLKAENASLRRQLGDHYQPVTVMPTRKHARKSGTK